MTLQESKDSTAANNHYVNWGLVLQLSVDGSLNKEKLDALVNEAAELYARSKAEEAWNTMDNLHSRSFTTRTFNDWWNATKPEFKP